MQILLPLLALVQTLLLLAAIEKWKAINARMRLDRLMDKMAKDDEPEDWPMGDNPKVSVKPRRVSY